MHFGLSSPALLEIATRNVYNERDRSIQSPLIGEDGLLIDSPLRQSSGMFRQLHDGSVGAWALGAHGQPAPYVMMCDIDRAVVDKVPRSDRYFSAPEFYLQVEIQDSENWVQQLAEAEQKFVERFMTAASVSVANARHVTAESLLASQDFHKIDRLLVTARRWAVQDRTLDQNYLPIPLTHCCSLTVSVMLVSASALQQLQELDTVLQ